MSILLDTNVMPRYLPPITHGAYLRIMYATGRSIAMVAKVYRREINKEPFAKSSGSPNTQTAIPVITLIARTFKEKITMASWPTREIALENEINLATTTQNRMPEKLPRKKRPKLPYFRYPISIVVLNFNDSVCKPKIMTSNSSILRAFGL